MVGFDPESKKQLSKFDYALAGALSGVFTRATCQPLDVLKIRFQLQVEPLKRTHQSKYWGLFHATNTIIKEEGVGALWKGHVPAQILSVIYGSTQFASFEFLTKKYSLYKNTETKASPVINFSAGSISGCLATLVSSPFDVVRTRLIAQSEPKVYNGVLNCYCVIYQKEGIRAFYRGISASLLQIAPHTGLQFMFYNFLKNTWIKTLPSEEKNISFIGSILTGSLSGLASKTLVYPLDLIKKRMQIQGFQEHRKSFGKIFRCTSLLHCILLIIREESLSSLFKGLTPSLIKASATSALHFAFYEQFCNILSVIKYSSYN